MDDLTLAHEIISGMNHHPYESKEAWLAAEFAAVRAEAKAEGANEERRLHSEPAERKVAALTAANGRYREAYGIAVEALQILQRRWNTLADNRSDEVLVKAAVKYISEATSAICRAQRAALAAGEESHD